MNGFFAAQSLVVNVALGLSALVLLVLSANLAVKKLIGLADYFHLSTTFMGVTVVSLATSIPEITAHLVASAGILRGTMDYEIGSAIVLGTNIGSDVVQQTLIMGLVVFMTGALSFRRYFLWKSMVPMIGTTIMCLILGWDRSYSRLDGLILFATFIGYMYYLYIDERKHYKREDNVQEQGDAPQNGRQVAWWILISLAAMGLAVFGAQIALNVTELIVVRTGVSGSLIGVVLLGVASALPELTTAISGVRHNAHGISLGTLVGSNITNPLVAIGGGALVSGYWVPRSLVHWDLPWEAVTGLILWGLLWVTRGKLGKWGAFYLVSLYAVYIVFRVVLFAAD
jgi:cation:H+ antiporter